jgi:L-amino acid N-acyltransferase YncA
MSADLNIRLIAPGDAEATLAIYRPYVENTIISFEYEAPSLQEWETRVHANTADYPWLVCEYKGHIIGYAYGSRHRYRTAYTWSPESTVYMTPEFQGRGIARLLYETLFAIMKEQGYVNVYAGVGLPNVKSEKFHEALGFYEVGIFKKIGFKLGAWHDTRWFQLHLTEHPKAPLAPKKLREIEQTQAFRDILAQANNRLKGKLPGRK